MTAEFVASAPGKVNLHLGVGEARADGYHDLSTVFQAVDVRETVRLRVTDQDTSAPGSSVVTDMSTTFNVTTPDEDIDTPANLAWRAVDAVVGEHHRRFGACELPRVSLAVEKNVFVAGGMAGGSADAAAALVAANAYIAEYGRGALDDDALLVIARALGADVAFCFMGGTALGTGRGDDLVEMMARGQYWWVFINPGVALPTGPVFSRLDDMRHNDPALVPHLDSTRLARALVAGDARRVGQALHNDLQPAALALRPQLAQLLAMGKDHGAHAIVSGSGPTVALLCRDVLHAVNTCDEIRNTHHGWETVFAHGPVRGAELV